MRGYELDDGSYITVEDRELEALEPEKTREIDLRQFVDLAELPAALLERGYYLTPQKEATKAYRLLAEAMERTKRAGIATFVMRKREYLVAIFAQGGFSAPHAAVRRRDSRSGDDRLTGKGRRGAAARRGIREVDRRAFGQDPRTRRAR